MKSIFRLLKISLRGDEAPACMSAVSIRPSWIFLTREEAVSQMRKAVKSNEDLDYTDDSYTVCDIDDYMSGHEHISPLFIFTPRQPVADALKVKFTSYLKKILSVSNR